MTQWTAPRVRPRVAMVGEDGNAFAILGRCQKAARRAGWTPAEWDAFRSEATSGGYDHLVQTVLAAFDDPDDDWDECPVCGEPILAGREHCAACEAEMKEGA